MDTWCMGLDTQWVQSLRSPITPATYITFTVIILNKYPSYCAHIPTFAIIKVVTKSFMYFYIVLYCSFHATLHFFLIISASLSISIIQLKHSLLNRVVAHPIYRFCWFACSTELSDPYHQSRCLSVCLSVILSGVLARSPTSSWPIFMKLGS